MLAFTNTIENKEQAVANAKWHREQDMLIAGTYGDTEADTFKGCSVGCTYSPFADDGLDNLHILSEKVHGIPEWLTHVRDTVFEGLPEGGRNDWHVDFNEAINVGSDLDIIKAPFLIYVLKRTLTTFEHDGFPGVKAAIGGSIALWERGDIGSDDWEKAAGAAAGAAAEVAEAAAAEAGRAAEAAWAAAEAAAAGAWAAAEVAAEAAAWAAAEAAEAAAGAGARAAAAAGAWAAEAAAAARAGAAEAYGEIRDELLRLIRECGKGE